QIPSVAVNSNTDRIYAANRFANVISVIDGSTDSVIATIAGINQPYGLAVNPNTNRLYVTNGVAVDVVDLSTNTLLGTIPVGPSPYGVAVNPNTNKIYVTNQGSGRAGDCSSFVFPAQSGCGNTMSVIDGVTNTVTATVAVGAKP